MPREQIFHEFKQGTLKSSSGKKVTSRKQAIAIALSYPPEKRSRRGAGRKTGR